MVTSPVSCDRAVVVLEGTEGREGWLPDGATERKRALNFKLTCSVSTLRQKHDVVRQHTQEQFVTAANGGSRMHG